MENIRISDFEYKHFLLTRFNVPIKTTLTKQLNCIDVATDETYLRERFRLFLEYTVPSVKNQTNQNFIWIVLLSNQTPEYFKGIISNLVDEMKNIVPLYIDINEDLDICLKKYICSFNTKWIITSRVDNDDALNMNFIDNIQTYFKENEKSKYVLIFDNGVQFDEKNGMLSNYRFPLNHFSSLVSIYNPNTIDTILNYNHMEIRNELKVNSINNYKPMWLEVIHKTNVSNRMHIKKSTINKDFTVFSEFGLNANTQNINWIKSVVYSIKILPANIVRLIKQYGVKGILKKSSEKIKKQ